MEIHGKFGNSGGVTDPAVTVLEAAGVTDLEGVTRPGLCACGCGGAVVGRRRHVSARCRKRAERARGRALRSQWHGEAWVHREFGRAHTDTFNCRPIAELLARWVKGVSVDPFSRDSLLATWRNDVDPVTAAPVHVDAVTFLGSLVGRVVADVVLLDPPYSFEQARRAYRCGGPGVIVANDSAAMRPVRDAAGLLVREGGVVISFGWNSMGMGMGRGYKLAEMLIVCHGAGHYDTLVTVERKSCDGPGGVASDGFPLFEGVM